MAAAIFKRLQTFGKFLNFPKVIHQWRCLPLWKARLPRNTCIRQRIGTAGIVIKLLEVSLEVLLQRPFNNFPKVKLLPKVTPALYA